MNLLQTLYMTIHYRLKNDGQGNMIATGEKFANVWTHVPISPKYQDETARYKIDIALDELLDKPVLEVTKIG